jgi:atypical dual specificity phosphatase
VTKKSIESLAAPMLPALKENPETKNHPTKVDGLAEEEQRKAEQRAQRKAPRCIICMGLPGSGKSTFAYHLAKSFPPENSWLVLNQDRLGKRECERLAGTCNSKRHRVILDRCNPKESERATWLEKLRSPAKGDVALVYFAMDAETCARRVASRTGHETIPKGSRSGRRIVTEMENLLEPPTPSEEKRFGSVHVVHTFEDAEEVLRSFGARV